MNFHCVDRKTNEFELNIIFRNLHNSDECVCNLYAGGKKKKRGEHSCQGLHDTIRELVYFD